MKNIYYKFLFRIRFLKIRNLLTNMIRNSQKIVCANIPLEF